MDRTTNIPKATLNDRAFAVEVIANPKEPKYKAYMKTHKTNNAHAARVETARLLAKPSVQAILAEADTLSQLTITEMMQQREDKRLAFDAARDIQDRVHGKASQRVESVSASFIHHTSDKAKEYGLQ